MIAVGVFVYQRTGSAFLIAMMAMLRLLPMGLLGAFLGAWTERMERRRTLVGIVALMGATSLLLGLLAAADRLETWHIAVACCVNGLGWAADNLVRRVMIGDSVGANRMGAAMSLDVGACNASRMTGPTHAGFLLSYFGIEGVVALSVGLYAIALAAARPVTSTILVVGRDQFGLGSEGVGTLASMDSVGAFIGALLLAMFVRPAWYGRTYCWGVLLYTAMLTLFALVPNPLLSICIGSGPLGFVGIGMLVDAVGANWATVASGIAGLPAMALAWRYWRAV